MRSTVVVRSILVEPITPMRGRFVILFLPQAGRRRRGRRLMSVQARESIRTPILAANAMMEEEEPVRVVFAFDREEAVVVLAPERLLPMRLEIVGFPDVRADAR